MKKIFTLCVSLLMGCVALNAQTFAFVDGETVIENGSTYNLSEAEIAAEGWGSAYQVPIFEGFNVKNVSNAGGSYDIKFHLVSLPAGSSFMACPYMQTCNPTTEDVSFTRPLGAGTIDGVWGIEWICGQATLNPDTYQYTLPINDEVIGTCTVEISVGPAGFTTPDSKITVNFTNNGSTSTGISGVEAGKDNAVVGYYTVGGAKLNAPQKGLNIVKYADGTTKKIIKK